MDAALSALVGAAIAVGGGVSAAASVSVTRCQHARTRYSVVSHEALAVSHESPAPHAPPIIGPAGAHDVYSPILLLTSQPCHLRASTRRAVAGSRPGLPGEAVF